MHDVFISYSRKDKAFVEAMHGALAAQNHDVWVDWEDIPLSADFMAEIYAGIEAADTFIFVLSPDSLASEVCALEVEHAVKHHKRLVPVLRRDVNAKLVPQPLAAHNWVYCREQDDIAAGIASLVRAVGTDLLHTKAHTRLLTRALEWERKGHEPSLLLRGRDLQEAEAWLGASDKEPQPTALQRQYALESRRAATRRQRQLLGSVVSALVLTAVLAVVAAWQWRTATVAEAEALHQADLATTAQQLAERERAAAVTRQLAAEAEATRNQRASLLPQSLLLAATSLRREPSLAAEGALHRGLALLPRSVALLQHAQSVEAIVVVPDASAVVTVSGNAATLWSLPKGERVSTMSHDALIAAVDVSPDGTRLATASWDNTVRIWSLPDGAEVSRVEYEDAVWGVAWSVDGRYLATAPIRNGVRVWDVVTKREVARLGANDPADFSFVTHMRWSPDGGRLAIAGSDGVTRIWAVAEGRELVSVRHDGVFAMINALAWSPDGAYLATASGDHSGRVWDAQSGAELLRNVHDAEASAVAFSPDGSYIALGAEDGSVAVWDLRYRIALQRVRHQGGIEALAWSRDSQVLLSASSDATARMWSVVDGGEIGRMPHSAGVRAVAATPDGAFVITASEDGTARVWEARGGFEAGRVIFPSGVEASAFSPDGRYVAASVVDGTLRCYELTTGREVLSLAIGRRNGILSFSPDGRYLAAASYNPLATTVYDLTSGKEVAQLPDALSLRTALLWSPDARRIAIYGLSGANVWEVASRRKLLDIEAPTGVVFDMLAWNPDSSEVMSVRSGELNGAFGTWGQRWDLRSGSSVTFALPGSINKLAWSPDGATVATVADDSTTVRLISATTGEEQRTLQHDDAIRDLAWSPDGTHLATAADDDQARVWNAADGALVARLPHQDDVLALGWNADGSRVATGSADLTARVWEATTGQELAHIPHDDAVTSVAFAADDTRLATASHDQGASVWLLEPDDLIAETCTRLIRNLTPDEWRQYAGDEPYAKTCPSLP